jgi:putative transposase
MKSRQKFASVHANVHNHFSSERYIVDRQTYKERRSAALAEWRQLAREYQGPNCNMGRAVRRRLTAPNRAIKVSRTSDRHAQRRRWKFIATPGDRQATSGR